MAQAKLNWKVAVDENGDPKANTFNAFTTGKLASVSAKTFQTDNGAEYHICDIQFPNEMRSGRLYKTSIEKNGMPVVGNSYTCILDLVQGIDEQGKKTQAIFATCLAIETSRVASDVSAYDLSELEA
jgi:hypothetical protein|tara:strand:+ start:122 stop:502 length:381 start_codon:yes stop_codon:yes gene_type:complete